MTIFGLCPALVVYGNVLLRVPPFVGDDDAEIIEAVAKMAKRVAAGEPPPPDEEPKSQASSLGGTAQKVRQMMGVSQKQVVPVGHVDGA